MSAPKKAKGISSGFFAAFEGRINGLLQNPDDIVRELLKSEPRTQHLERDENAEKRGHYVEAMNYWMNPPDGLTDEARAARIQIIGQFLFKLDIVAPPDKFPNAEEPMSLNVTWDVVDGDERSPEDNPRLSHHYDAIGFLLHPYLELMDEDAYAVRAAAGLYAAKALGVELTLDELAVKAEV